MSFVCTKLIPFFTQKSNVRILEKEEEKLKTERACNTFRVYKLLHK